jgi:CheY-like chemotaxis protein
LANVLVVDDDEAFARVIQRDLQAIGHQVTLVPDWTGVLDLLEGEAAIDIMITELRLPVGTPNGLSLARLALKRRSTLKVVYMTAFADVAVEIRQTLPNVVLKGSDSRAVLAAVDAALPSGP